MADYLDLSIGDSDMILVNELRDNPNNVYCDRHVIEGKWPPTSEEREKYPNSSYSKDSILKLLEEEGVTDRKITRHVPTDNVLFKKEN